MQRAYRWSLKEILHVFKGEPQEDDSVESKVQNMTYKNTFLQKTLNVKLCQNQNPDKVEVEFRSGLDLLFLFNN